MDVSEAVILHTWMPAIHAGMTKLSIFMFCGRALIMNHFVVEPIVTTKESTKSFTPPTPSRRL